MHLIRISRNASLRQSGALPASPEEEGMCSPWCRVSQQCTWTRLSAHCASSVLACSRSLALTALRCVCSRVDEGDLQQALTAAVTCTILAGAGPQRSRMLATLYKVTAPPQEGAPLAWKTLGARPGC